MSKKPNPRRAAHAANTCADCGGYAPHTPTGEPLWPGPRCTECAKKQYAARTGCALAEAEMRMLQERAQPPQIREAAAVWPAESPATRLLTQSAATCTVLDLLTVLLKRAEVAQALWQHYGSLPALARASALELARSIPGLGPRRAAQLHAACELGRRAGQVPLTPWPSIQSPADAAALLMPLVQGKDQEYLYVLLLNTRNRLLTAPIEVYHGSLSSAVIRAGEVFRDAVRFNAASILVAHNHPSGDPDPSPEDIAITRILRETGKLLDVELIDHLILGHQRFISLKERGLMTN